MFVTERQRERLFVRERVRETERERALFWRESENPSENQNLEERERDTVCLSFQKMSFAGL